MASFLPAPIGSGHPRRVPGPGVGRLWVQPYHTQPARCAQAAALFLALGFMRDVPTRWEQPALHGMGKQGWAADVAGSFWGERPVPGQTCLAAAGAMGRGGMERWFLLCFGHLYCTALKQLPRLSLHPAGDVLGCVIKCQQD